jgi:signal peptidase I
MKDGFREIVETVVFVVVLVLLLKGFLAEAFVIPTGSMATTLLGYHREDTCPQCGTRFLVNMSAELDQENPSPAIVTGSCCPNCFFPFTSPRTTVPHPRKEVQP